MYSRKLLDRVSPAPRRFGFSSFRLSKLLSRFSLYPFSKTTIDGFPGKERIECIAVENCKIIDVNIILLDKSRNPE
jgi:hypothetical protein